MFTFRGKSAAALALASALALSGCSDGGGGIGKPEAQFGYLLPEPLVTANAGSLLGTATDAGKLSARLFPGAFLAGPEGQMLPNRELVDVEPDPKRPEVVDYRINPKAKYSDGEPVVCDDFLLTKLAGQRPDLFASDMPLFNQVEELYCAPGAERFRVVFKPGFGKRYRELFDAGTVMPAHKLTQETKIESVPDLVASGDEEELARVGQAWQQAFRVDREDPAAIPTFGPFTISEKGERGELVLRENPHWAGDTPGQSPIYVWGRGADIAQLAEDNQISVLDAPVATDFPAVGITSEHFQTQRQPSDRVDSLMLADVGIFENEDARHAFNSCIDRNAIVEAVAEQSRNRVQPIGLRTNPPSAPMGDQLSALDKRQREVDLDSARAVLEGTQIRIGYLKGTGLYEHILNEITRSCQHAGVEIEKVPVSADEFGTLGEDYDALLVTHSSFGRYGASKADQTSLLPQVLAAERELHRSMWTIPLTSEPRALACLKNVDNILDNPGDVGLSWNMDRWAELDHVPEHSPSNAPRK